MDELIKCRDSTVCGNEMLRFRLPISISSRHCQLRSRPRLLISLKRSLWQYDLQLSLPQFLIFSRHSRLRTCQLQFLPQFLIFSKRFRWHTCQLQFRLLLLIFSMLIRQQLQLRFSIFSKHSQWQLGIRQGQQQVWIF